MQKINYSHFKLKKMKKKVDFTVKGTKLPVIPIGENYRTAYNPNVVNIFEIINNTDPLISYGVSEKFDDYICAEKDGYLGKNFYMFRRSTIEALAEEQGMLWVEDEAQKSQPKVIPSIEQLLIDCITLNNTIKTSCRLFESIDDNHKLTLMYNARVKLASKVAELNNILNPQPMQSVVEIAEDVLK